MKEGLKELVLNGTAQAVSFEGGLCYIITPEGEDYSESFDSEYADEYRRIAQKVIRMTADRSERTLIDAVYKLSAKSYHGEDVQ